MLSDLPLLLALIFIGLMLWAQLHFGFVVPSSEGAFAIDLSGRVVQGEGEYQIEKVYWYWSELKVVVDCCCGERFTFWRDSLTVQDYRHLILVLKQWKGRQGEAL